MHLLGDPPQRSLRRDSALGQAVGELAPLVNPGELTDVVALDHVHPYGDVDSDPLIVYLFV